MTKTEQTPEFLDEQQLDAVVGGGRSQCEHDDGHPSGVSSGGSGGPSFSGYIKIKKLDSGD